MRKVDEGLTTPEILAKMILKAVDLKTFTAADDIQEMIEKRPIEEVIETGCLVIPKIPLETRDLLQKNLLISSVEGMEPIGVALLALHTLRAPTFILEVISKLHNYDALACLFLLSTWENGVQALASINSILKGKPHDGEKRSNPKDSDREGQGGIQIPPGGVTVRTEDSPGKRESSTPDGSECSEGIDGLTSAELRDGYISGE